MWKVVRHNCKLVELMADYYATRCTVDYLRKTENVYFLPHDFLFEMVVAGARDKHLSLAQRKPGRKTKCHYHEHKNDYDKCK